MSGRTLVGTLLGMAGMVLAQLYSPGTILLVAGLVWALTRRIDHDEHPELPVGVIPRAELRALNRYANEMGS